MHCTIKINDSVTWVGASDRRLALFENLFPLPNGVSYNSYLISDEKTALIDTADSSVTKQLFENVSYALDGRSLDYLVISHMEPDHCAGIRELISRYPALKIVGNAKTFTYLKQFFELNLDGRTITVKDGDTLCLGKHNLSFILTPMVHWPEVMMTYDEYGGILFSADAFGAFGAIDGCIFSDELDFDALRLDEARRYYGNIVGKFGPQVQGAVKKLVSKEIKTICPLHGPIWRQNLNYILEKYDIWSHYRPEEKSVAIFYGSMYGNTADAVRILASKLAESGIKNLSVHDVSKTHISYLISEIFRASHTVFAAPTYNNGIYPKMSDLLNDMKALNLQNRIAGIIENGTWAPSSGKQMRAVLEELTGVTVLEPVVTVKSAVNRESLVQLEELKNAIAGSM